MSQWRLTLDNPYSFATQAGFIRSMKACDFRPEATQFAAAGLWREPLFGLVMLRPSSLDRNFTNDFQGLNNWNYQQAFWMEAKRAKALADYPAQGNGQAEPVQPASLMMAPVKPANKGFQLIELLIDIALIEIRNALNWYEQYDRMKWVLESKFTLAEDESFAIHYHAMSDEMLRKDNWMALQWDNIGLHFSHNGVLRVYRYNRADMTAQPVQVNEIELCSPSDILNRPGYFWFLPIPNVGLAVYHGIITQKNANIMSSAQSISVRGKLIPWETTPDDGAGHASLFQASKIRIAMNPFHPTMVGFQGIRFMPNKPATWVDGAFSLPSGMATAPALLTAFGAADRGTLTAALKGADPGKDWQLGETVGRVAVTLATADSKYTPFCNTYNVVWTPVFSSRTTVPLVLASRAADGVDRLQRLEFSDDANSHFEGKVELLLYSAAARHIALRGDATFLLEHSEDGGTTWFVFTGGLAKNWDIEVCHSTDWGTYFSCRVTLFDMWERFNETHILWQTSFDNLTIAASLNNLLASAGFSAIADAQMPPDALTTTIQKAPDGNSWRFSPRESEKAQDVIAMLFLYLRKQNVAYRIRYDWQARTWVPEQRPRDVNTIWKLYPFADSRTEIDSIWDYSKLTIHPEPPEANRVFVEGLTVPDPQHAFRVTVPPLVNEPSLYDVASDDYLGREMVFKGNMVEVLDPLVLQQMERRFFDAIAHRRLKATIESQHFTWMLGPNRRIQVYLPEGDMVLDTWIKHRTVVVEQADQETISLETDTVWEQEISRV